MTDCHTSCESVRDKAVGVVSAASMAGSSWDSASCSASAAVCSIAAPSSCSEPASVPGCCTESKPAPCSRGRGRGLVGMYHETATCSLCHTAHRVSVEQAAKPPAPELCQTIMPHQRKPDWFPSSAHLSALLPSSHGGDCCCSSSLCCSSGGRCSLCVSSCSISCCSIGAHSCG